MVEPMHFNLTSGKDTWVITIDAENLTVVCDAELFDDFKSFCRILGSWVEKNYPKMQPTIKVKNELMIGIIDNAQELQKPRFINDLFRDHQLSGPGQMLIIEERKPGDECAECGHPRSWHGYDVAGIPYCACGKHEFVEKEKEKDENG